MNNIVVYGSNKFEIDNFVHKEISQSLKLASDLEVIKIDFQDGLEERSYTDLLVIFKSMSLFSQNRSVILYNMSAKAEYLEQIIKQIIDKSLNEKMQIIFVEYKATLNKLFKLLPKVTQVAHYNNFTRSELLTWMIQYVKQLGGEVSNNSVNYLLDKTNYTDQYALKSELDKLCLYDKQITNKDIDLLVSYSPKDEIFKLMDAACNKDYLEVNRIYQDLQFLKIEKVKIIGLINWQLHLMSVVLYSSSKNNDEIAKDLNAKPYTIKMTRRLTSHIDKLTIKKLINQLLVIDQGFKDSLLDVDLALLNYLYSF